MIIFTNLPKRGDAVLGELATGKVRYVVADQFVGAGEVDLSKYEIIGVVVERVGDSALIAYKNSASRVWAKRYSFALTGYTLDGTDRTGVLNIRQASNSWGSNVSYTVSYNATTVAQLVTQLNAFFTDTTNPVFQQQDWYAEANDNVITLSFDYVAYQQASNSGSSGFSLSANFLPDVPALANMRRKHGGNGGEGAVSSYYRALAYFRADNSSETYNPTSNVTDIRTSYPVCLPAYMGTSSYRKDGDTQLDYCSLLRSTYGEGEAGWQKYMQSCMPVVPTDFGNMGMTDGLAYTKLMAEKRYNSNTKQNEVLCPAASYCYGISTTCIPAGNWFLGTARDVSETLKDIKYPSHGGVTSDIVNATLSKIGGSQISNGSHWWSSLRSNSRDAWLARGGYGFFNFNGFYVSGGCLPLSLQKLA